ECPRNAAQRGPARAPYLAGNRDKQRASCRRASAPSRAFRSRCRGRLAPRQYAQRPEAEAENRRRASDASSCQDLPGSIPPKGKPVIALQATSDTGGRCDNTAADKGRTEGRQARAHSFGFCHALYETPRHEVVPAAREHEGVLLFQLAQPDDDVV